MPRKNPVRIRTDLSKIDGELIQCALSKFKSNYAFCQYLVKFFLHAMLLTQYEEPTLKKKDIAKIQKEMEKVIKKYNARKLGS